MSNIQTKLKYVKASPAGKGRTQFTSPPGSAQYPHLTYYDDKPIGGNAQTPAYKTNLILEGAAAAEMKALIDEMVDAAWDRETAEMKAGDVKKYSKAYPYEDECDDDGNETGRTIFRFKQNAFIKDELVNLPIFDRGGKVIPKSSPVWGGSVLQAAWTSRTYAMGSSKKVGITMDLRAVMVHDLVTKGQRSADGFGFDVDSNFESDYGSDDGGDDGDDAGAPFDTDGSGGGGGEAQPSYNF